MDIKSFVSETLTQILDGIREAQRRPGGEDVGADGYISASDAKLMNGGTSGFFTTVDFDISVVAETKEGGGSVRVADAQIAEGGSKTAQNASRVKFSLHMRIPKGGNVRPDPDAYSGRASGNWSPHDY